MYFLWALRNSLTASTSCPACGSPTKLVRRKYGVTALRECSVCALRFRTPKDARESAEKFYVEEVYKQGFTTDLPSDKELQAMLARNFTGTEKDFSSPIEVLFSAGLRPGARVLDFGSSWGYGSWQMRKAGFDVLSYEIGRGRARYAKEKLGCIMVENLRELDGSVDCFFSSHVIEHLPDPNILFDEAQHALKPDGIFVCFCPNGATEREQEHGRQIYDDHWGAIHPLMVTPNFMRHETLKRRRFASCNVFSYPFNPAEVRDRRDGKLDGSELLTVAYLGGNNQAH